MAVHIIVENSSMEYKMVKESTFAHLEIISMDFLIVVKRKKEQEDKDVTMETMLEDLQILYTMEMEH